MLGAFLFLVPAVILSGFATPIANMPEVVQWITYLDPLRYFLIAVRGVFLGGEKEPQAHVPVIAATNRDLNSLIFDSFTPSGQGHEA